jgi:4-hydroxythreonine-4-phosphate dehydrogenase
MPSKPIIAVSTGEPAGIGPDISLLMAQHRIPGKPIFIGSYDVLKERVAQRNMNIEIVKISHINEVAEHKAGVIQLIDIPVFETVTAGKLNKNNADYVLNIIKQCTDLCRMGNAQAMVTAPVQKSILSSQSILFRGHTEFIADQLNEKNSLMMLASEEMRIALLTTHLPLSQVSSHISFNKIIESTKILHAGLIKFFNICNPVINIMSLNPHAGEEGTLGSEELEIIVPAITKLKKDGLSVIGPTPADTAFTKSNSDCDAYLSMYHDQALPVLKAISFNKIVNITLGLSIIRTSVDHGTALSIVGSNQVKEESFVQAYRMAFKMTQSA